MNFLSYILAILLGSSSLAFSAPSIPASALPATLKPEPHQRDPYGMPGMKPLKKETGPSSLNT